ncbi:hypothetical protein H4R18_003313 [Coemansia javaensis]|uniref:Globin-sensor domain-containing protein n=1 Tax=Coemansia javaensis TaxID=2761396 RepID=A0A9W8LIS1_9FUNG|nr:hypothetical protein H4R18_003313 [Coemansia javaensis]
MERLDRERLYTDSQYRFEYLAGFVGFTEGDQEMIHKSASLLADRVPAIADAVYEKLFCYDATWAPFTQDQSGLPVRDKADSDPVTIDSEVIVFRKMMLVRYLRKLLTCEWNQGYVKYLEWVGNIHTTTPLKESTVDVDYIHLNAMLGFISDHIIAMVYDSDQWDEETKYAIVCAYNKFFWIQNDMFARPHIKDGVLTEEERAAVARKEKDRISAIRRGIWTEFFAVTVLGAALGAVAGAGAYRLFSK